MGYYAEKQSFKKHRGSLGNFGHDQGLQFLV